MKCRNKQNKPEGQCDNSSLIIYNISDPLFTVYIIERIWKNEKCMDIIFALVCTVKSSRGIDREREHGRVGQSERKRLIQQQGRGRPERNSKT